MDDSTRDKFIREAKGLGGGFSSGKSGFLDDWIRPVCITY